MQQEAQASYFPHPAAEEEVPEFSFLSVNEARPAAESGSTV